MSRAARELRSLERQLPTVATALARSVRAGASLHLAVGEVATGTTPPVRGDLDELLGAVGRGVGLDDALVQWERRRRSHAVTLVVAACRLGLADGGELAAALDGVAVSLLDTLEIADEARALSSQARSSAAVLVALPVLGAVGFSMVEPAVASMLLTTRAGWLCLVVGVGLDVAGAKVIARLVRSVST
jgi:tight adherence protein B